MSREIDVNAPGVVVMLSGGIDSLAALYLTLRDTTRPVHVRHIRMKWERRVRQEFAAVTRQMKWLAANVRPFTSSVVVDPRDFETSRERDENIILPEAARALRELGPEFGRVMTGRCIEETEHGDADFDGAHAAFQAIAGVPYAAARLYDPSREWSKRAKFDALPPEIRSSGWGCRGTFRPDGGPCGRCFPCRRYQDLGIFEATHL